MTSRFRVSINIPGFPREATVSIERDRGLVAVRPLRRRQEFVLPLSWVAEAIIWKCVRADAAQKRRTRARS